MRHIHKMKLSRKITSGVCSNIYFDFFEDKNKKIWIQPFIGNISGHKCTPLEFLEAWSKDFNITKIPRDLLNKIQQQAIAEKI